MNHAAQMKPVWGQQELCLVKERKKNITATLQKHFNPRRPKVKKVTRRHGGGGGHSEPSPLLLTPFIRLTRYLAHIMSVLCTIKLIENTWCSIGFNANHSNIMTSLAAAILDLQIFNFFQKSNLNTENSEKTTFSDWNLHHFKIHGKIINI